MYKTNFSFPLALLLLVSCSDEKESPVVSRGIPVQFSSGLSGMVESRAANGSWDAGDEVGIYMIPAVASASSVDFSTYTDERNVPYVTSGAGEYVSLSVMSGHKAICYPQDGSEVNFVAYYPYKAVTSTDGDICRVDVTDQSDLKAIDLIYHNGAGHAYDKDTDAADVELEFTHQLSKLNVCLIPASEEVAVDFESDPPLLTLTGFPSTAVLLLWDGNLYPQDSGTNLITASPLTSSPRQALYEAIVIPHNMASYSSSHRMSFAIDDTEYHYELPASTVLEKGIAYNYIFKFTGTEVVLVKKTIVDWEGGTVAWGDNLLTISNTVFNLTASGANKDTGTPLQVEFQTTVTGAAFTTKSDDAWLAPTLDLVGEEDGWKKYRLVFTADNTLSARTGYIFIQTEGLNIAVRVDQDGTSIMMPSGVANCYIVTPGGTKTFKVSLAYQYEDGAITDKLWVDPHGTNYTNEFGAEVEWDDNSVINATTVSGYGNQAEVTVTTKNVSAGGNAVVKIFKKGDTAKTPVWSYHIWVTDYDPNTGPTWTNPNQTSKTYTFMDRNLGATAATLSLAARGLLYQWGRKDPFPGVTSGTAGHAALNKFKGMADAGSPTRVKVTATNIVAGIVESVQKPTTFISYSNNSNYNWLPAFEKGLWNTAIGQKTIFDPCPEGWRVPVRVDGTISIQDDVYSPWYGYTTSMYIGQGINDGITLEANALYPFVYQRNGDGTTITNGQSGVCLWQTSCLYKEDLWWAICFRYRTNWQWQLSYITNYTTSGYSIRCVID
jgi:hypothetical protein